MSQFDTLFDFGDSPAPETNGTTQQNFDEFDPFSPSTTTTTTVMEGKTTTDSGNLLVDFGLDSQVTNSEQQNGLNTDPFNGHQFDDTSPNTNPLYEMSSDNTNPLYDFDNSQSEFANEVLSAVESNQKMSTPNQSNPLYDLTNEEIDDEALFSPSETSNSAGANPLYEYAENESTESTEQQCEAENDSFVIESSNITQDSSYEQDNSRDQTNFEYSNNGQFDDSNQESDQIQEVRNSGGNWEENISTETFTSSNAGPEGEIITETIVTRTTKSRSRSPEVVETVREVRKSRSRSPEIVTEVRSSSPEITHEIIQDDVHDNFQQEEENVQQQEIQQNFVQPEIEEDMTKETKTSAVKDGGRTVTTTTTTTETKTIAEVKGGPKGGSSSMKVKQESTVSAPKSTIQQNGVDSSVKSQSKREEVRQTEISRNMANVAASAPVNNQHIEDFEEDGEDDEGVFENVPSAPRTDVYRETDIKTELELPQLGRAQNMKERFLKLAGESASGAKTSDKELTPPPAVRGPIEAGVFESQPTPKREDIDRYTDNRRAEVVSEKGKTLNTVARYKEIESKEFKGPANKREITPDRSGVVEYVSEPRAEHMTYDEAPIEAGIFESKPTVTENVSRYEDYVPDELPIIGTARNIASRFQEIEKNATLPPLPSNRREITPDRHGHGEYISEPRAQHLTYEEKIEGGIYENEPAPVREDIYRHEEYHVQDPLPEKGYAKNLVSRFREIEKSASVPVTSGRQVPVLKDDSKNVYENVPTESNVLYKETVQHHDVLPEKGQAKNLASRYHVIEQENLRAKTGNRQVKEFTPPKDERMVFESEPKPSTYCYDDTPVESGILENEPTKREGVFRESDSRDIEVELPEIGVTKNLLSRWKQIESESGKNSPPTPGKVKEFTPPREDDRVRELRSNLSPTSHGNSVQPNDLPGQYQQQNQPTVFESQPSVPRDDIYREADTDWSIGLPKSNKTKKVLAKFQAIQSQAQSTPVSPVHKKEERVIPTPVKTKDNNKAKKGSIFVAVQNEKCGVCQKTVYAMEKVEMNKNAYHRACFRCSECSAVLTPKTFAINAGTMFCTSHYKQLFARKGNYDEGFGRPQHKKKWKSEPNLLVDSELHEHEIEA